MTLPARQILKPKDIPAYRQMFAAKQSHACGICGGRLAFESPCLDHDHANGMVRATLCGTCNRNEGKVRVAIRYMSRMHHLTRTDPIEWMRRLVTYLEYHRDNPTNIIHPSFDLKTGKQKPIKKAVKRKKKKA